MPSLSHLYDLAQRVRTLLIKQPYFPIFPECIVVFTIGCWKRVRLVLRRFWRELGFPERLVGVIRLLDPQNMAPPQPS
jgi:hypothetical protein